LPDNIGFEDKSSRCLSHPLGKEYSAGGQLIDDVSKGQQHSLPIGFELRLRNIRQIHIK
jgi:hypothetical protein